MSKHGSKTYAPYAKVQIKKADSNLNNLTVHNFKSTSDGEAEFKNTITGKTPGMKTV